MYRNDLTGPAFSAVGNVPRRGRVPMKCCPARYFCGMTPRQLDLLAVVGCVTCWGAVSLAWLGGAIYYDTQDPGERTRARWFGSGAGTGAVDCHRSPAGSGP